MPSVKLTLKPARPTRRRFRNPSARVVVGPDEQGPGVSYVATMRKGGEDRHLDSGGWGGKGPRSHADPDAWLALARKHLKLPKQVKAAGLGWGDARVEPFGWSEGRGHAPSGITITWSWRDT